ncbi:MAG TPA: zinc-finger domain-containing protein [Burkholderiaceae bacterium]|nr:zinc-finger domain-containing protein [Burkholderiaceae bacterium]
MSSAPDTATPRDEAIPVSASDLPLYCPSPKAPLWSMHPRVYIEIEKDGQAICPYCSAKYQLTPSDVSDPR